MNKIEYPVRHKTMSNVRLRKITFIKDSSDNYKICDIIKRPRLHSKFSH